MGGPPPAKGEGDVYRAVTSSQEATKFMGKVAFNNSNVMTKTLNRDSRDSFIHSS